MWVGADGGARQGDARDLVGEIRTFHTTGSFTGADDLARSVVARMREIAADDDTPWVKIGDVVFRAESVDDDGRTLLVVAHTRDRDVLHALQAMRPDQMRSSPDLPVTTFDNSGSIRISEVATETLSASVRRVRIAGIVEWADGRRSSLAAGLNGITVEEQVEIGLNAGLFSAPLPDRLGWLASSVDSSDPLADLDQLALPHGLYEPVARLMLVERLLGGRGASRVEEVAIGPVHNGRRPIVVAWRDARWVTNVEPGRREVSGVRISAS